MNVLPLFLVPALAIGGLAPSSQNESNDSDLIQPRIVFAAPELILSETATRDVFAVVQLVDCPERTPKGAVEFEVVAVDSSANEGADYFAFGKNTLGTPAPEGETSRLRTYRLREIPLHIVDDEESEPLESFSLELRLLPGSTLDCGSGLQQVALGPALTVSIEDNDGVSIADSPSAAPAAATLAEGGDAELAANAPAELRKVAGKRPQPMPLSDDVRIAAPASQSALEIEEGAPTDIKVGPVRSEASPRQSDARGVARFVESEIHLARTAFARTIGIPAVRANVAESLDLRCVTKGAGAAVKTQWLRWRAGDSSSRSCTVSVAASGETRKKKFELLLQSVPDGRTVARTLIVFEG